MNKNLIISVIGHADQGKTTFLKGIAEANNMQLDTKHEISGMTQNFLPFKVNDYVFFDTPGQESFSYIRENLFIISDLVIILLSLKSKDLSNFFNIVKSVEKSNKKFLIVLSHFDLVTENELLEFVDIHLNDYKSICILIQYSNKTYNDFNLLNICKITDFIIYLNEFFELLEFNYIFPDKLFIIDSVSSKGSSSLYFCLNTSNDVIYLNDFKRLKVKLYSLEKHSINKVLNRQFFFLKLDKTLSISSFYNPKLIHEIFDLLPESSSNENELEIFLISDFRNKVQSVINFCINNNIKFYLKVGKLNDLDLALLKEKKCSIVLFDSSFYDKNSFKNSKVIFSSNYFEIINELNILKEKFEKSVAIKKMLSENHGIAKVIKIFSSAYGCSLNKGYCNLNDKVYIISGENLFITNIKNLKIKKDDCVVILEGNQFGISLEDTSLKLNMNDKLYFV